MSEYPKISTPFKRYREGPDKGKLIIGSWAAPEFDYLSTNNWEWTEKVDGTNIRIEITISGDDCVINHRGRTDNANIPKHLLEYLEEYFPDTPRWRRDVTKPTYSKRNDEIRNWMLDNGLTTVTLYGEGYGPKIQKGGGNYRDDASFVLFDVNIGGFWLSRENVNDVAAKLGIDAVPVVGRGTIFDAICIVKGSTPVGQQWNVEFGYWWGKDGMKSAWGDFEAEGLVGRPTTALFSAKGERITTKVKAVDFR